MPNTRRANAEPAVADEVDQINTDFGNGEGSSNTFNGAPQGLTGDANDNNINPGNKDDALIDAQVAAAQAAEQALAAEVEALQQKQELVDTINQRILQLEQHKRTLGDTLRFTTSSSSSIREPTPVSAVLPSREGLRPELERTPVPDVMDLDIDLDTIHPEPPYNVLKMALD